MKLLEQATGKLGLRMVKIWTSSKLFREWFILAPPDLVGDVGIFGHRLVGQTNENHPFSHSMIHCFPLECVCEGGCPHPECYLQQWGAPVSDNDNAIKHLQETRTKLICSKCHSSSHARGMLRACLHCPLPHSVLPRPQSGLCLSNFVALSTHPLESSIVFRVDA